MAKTRDIGAFFSEKEIDNGDGVNYIIAIGIDKYSFFPSLYSPVKDTNDLVNVLTTRYQFEANNVFLLLDEAATRRNIYETFRKVIDQLTKSDNLLIYYSGHGYFDKITNEGYWIPSDAEYDRISDFIENSLISSFIKAMRAHHVFLISDAIFNQILMRR